MFINQGFHWSEMSNEFQQAETEHTDNLPKSFDDAIYFDVVMLFFGL